MQKKKKKKIDWENVFGDIGTKEGVPMKIKSKLMSKVNFIQNILLPKFGTKFYMEKGDIYHFQTSFIKAFCNKLLL